MSVTAIFVMSAVVVFITVFCFVATRYSMFCDEKPREQRNYLYPPDCRRPNPCAYVVISLGDYLFHGRQTGDGSPIAHGLGQPPLE